VPLALAAVDQRGTVAIAGIHLSDVPALDYRRHLFGEKTLTSVTSNTRVDGREFLGLAEGVVHATVTPYPFERAPDALRDLADGRVNGAAVLEL
jgi:propanol-preferring alcohol dehydrogenase